MNRELSTGSILQLLDALQAAVTEFAARAEKLEKDQATRRAREQQSEKTALQQVQTELDSALAETGQAMQTGRKTLEDRFNRRKAWISRAFKSSREQVLTRIEDRIGARRYDVQTRTLKAEKDRDAGLKAAMDSAHDFRAQLAAAEQDLAAAETVANKAFSGYAGLQKLLRPPESYPAESADEYRLLEEMRSLTARAQEDLKRFRGAILVRLLRYWPLWLLVVPGIALGLVPVLQNSAYGWKEAGIAAAAGLALVLALRAVLARGMRGKAGSAASALLRARGLYNICMDKSETRYQDEVARVNATFTSTVQEMERGFKEEQGSASQRRVDLRIRTDEKGARAGVTNQRQYETRLAALDREHGDVLGRLRQTFALRKETAQKSLEQGRTRLQTEFEAAWKAFEAEWKGRIDPIYARINAAATKAKELFPEWETLRPWSPPKSFAGAARYGRIKADLGLGLLPATRRQLSLPDVSELELPLCLAYPEEGSILIETGATGHDEAISCINSIILRLLSVTPPGRLNFTILDPVGLGQNFAGVMHLADYEEQLINSRIWTQSSQIEQRLGDLNEHMEKVIQMYLRNEYQTIAEYNAQAGVIAEKYYFLVVADFPTGFTDTAVKRLQSIAASGARCGVFVLLHWDTRVPAPQDFLPEELRKACVRVVRRENLFALAGRTDLNSILLLDKAPPAELATDLVHQIGQASRDSSRVEVPFDHVMPKPEEIWSQDTSVELTVPVGRTGATKLQYLAIGKGTRQHGLVAGKTGSGKSTLFHVMITNLSLWCSPDQVEFYLVDFKKGVEFKSYASKKLPHARVVAIESDREFGLSVLQKVDDELRRRGDLFRKLGVQDLAGYKRAAGTEKLPRSLLLIDEFQEFFVEDDKVAQTASLLLDRIVRQGRAFGIHVILGSQTLGGAYTVARTTLGQMVIRIALQCNEADAYMIMDENNPAPRLLSRPGEGIYNDQAGAIEGNSPFQTVWLSDRERDHWLGEVRRRADEAAYKDLAPFVFEGNAPADVRDNRALERALSSPPRTPPAIARLYLGAPNSIKGPTEAALQRQSGNNVLLVGQREEAILAILTVSLVSLASQFPKGAARIIVFDITPPEMPERQYLEKVVGSLSGRVELAKQSDLQRILGELTDEMKRRGDETDASAAVPVFLFINGMQRFNKLRYEEDFGFSSEDVGEAKPSALVNTLLTEGTRFGFHVIASCDTWNNVNRYLSRKGLSEFEMRVLFQMSANDSASLIDNPRASTLGLHRALFFNAQEGYLETFRPYALPDPDWIESLRPALT